MAVIDPEPNTMLPTGGPGQGGRRANRNRRIARRVQEEGETPTEETPTEETPQYNYSDPGRFGERGYEYQVGDEMTAPGPEPPRDSPEWGDWKKHAAAWRNFIGGRQQYVNQMIGVGYSPEDLGIFNRKEEGMAGYRRLAQPGVTEGLRQNATDWMRNSSDAQIDPITGLYSSGNNYYDARGMRVNQSGSRVGGFYGQQNTTGQFGGQAVPRTVSNPGGPVQRPGVPRPSNVPQPTAPLPTAPPPTQALGGWGQAMTGDRLHIANRNRRPPNPYGI